MEQRHLQLIGPLLVGGIVVVLAWVGYSAAVLYLPFSAETKAFWGEAFGGLSSLFAGLAFMGLVISVYLQSREISRLAQEQKDSSALLGQQVRALRATAKLNYLNDMIAFERNALEKSNQNISIDERTEDAVERQNMTAAIKKLVEQRRQLIDEL